MKKTLLNVLMLLMVTLWAGPWRASAQDVLTVADGTVTNDHVPIYGLYLDNYIRTQIIYPEDLLTDLVGSTISQLTFHMSSLPTNPSNWTSVLNVKMGTVTESAFTSASFSNATTDIVYTGTLNGSTNAMTIVLEAPYYYEGGNLLLEFASVTEGGYSGASFYGITSTGASLSGYSSSSAASINPTLRNFIPKTTFTYTAGEISCHSVGAPSVSSITSTNAVVTWGTPVDGGSYIVQYKTANQSWDNADVVTDFVTDTTYDFMDMLNPVTTYNMRIANYCGGTDTSSWRNITFTTDCGAISTLPYTMDFEGYPSSGSPVPQCWTRVLGYTGYSSTYPYVASSSYSSYEGSGYLSFYGNNVIALPVFADNLNTLRMTFWMKPGNNTASYGHTDVGILTNLSDTSSFQVVQSWEATDLTSAYQFFTVDFNNVTVTDSAWIAFRSVAPSGYNWYVDNLTVLPIPACIEPAGVTATTPDAYTADVAWTGGNAPYTVYYKTTDEIEYTAVSGIYDTTYTLTGLIPVTQYQVYVTSGCPDGTESASQVGTFKTPCAAFEAPFFEDFNAGTNMPDCWMRLQGLASDAFADTLVTETTNGWNFNNNYAFGQYHARLNIFGTSTKYWLVTPQIDLSTLSNPALRFDMALTRYNTSNPIDNDSTEQADDKFMVIVSTDNGAHWSAANATVWDNTGNGDYVYNRISSICEKVTIDLAQYAGQNVRIAFYGESTVAGGDNDLHIDNVTVDELPACVAPTQVVVSNVTGNTADIAWTENGTSTSWTVEYGPAGFEAGTGTQENVSGTPSLTLNGLNPAMQYEVRIFSDCASDTACKLFVTACMPFSAVPFTWNFDENLLAGTSSYPLPTCWTRITPSGAGSTLYPYSYISSTYAHSGTRSLYFGNYYGTQYAIMPELDINTLDLTNLVVTFFARNSASGTNIEVGVMSDPTDPATFTVLQSVTPLTTASADPFAVSLASAIGQGSYIAFRNITAGGSYTYTYVDDVTLTDLSGCTAPMQLTSIPAPHSATLSWVGNANSYDLYYKAASDTEYVEFIGAELDVDGNYELAGLTPSTSYQWYVVSHCDDTAYTSGILTFTTPCEGIATLPQSWDFESGNTGGTTSYPLPACWNRITPSAASSLYPYVTSSTSNAHNSSYYLYFYNNYPNQYAIMPYIDATALSMNELQVSFFARMSSVDTNTFLVVGVMSNPENAGSFVPVDTLALTNSYTTEPIVVTFDNYTGNGSYIAFKNIVVGSSNYTAFYVDDIQLSYIPVCDAPTGVTAAPAVTDAVVTWNGTSSSYNVYYKAATDSLYMVQENVNSGFTLGNLTASTAYMLYVAAICEDGSEATSPIVLFSTDCAPETVPYTENFNGGTTIPDCWKTYAGFADSVFNGAAMTASTSYWSFSNTQVFGANHTRINIYGTGVHNWLVSPAIELTGLSTPALTFDMALTKFNTANAIEDTTAQQDDKFMVVISTDNGATWSAANATVWDNTGNGDHSYNHISTTGDEITIPLAQYAGQTIRIGFYGESTVAGGDNDLHIDNVHVGEQAACATPTQFTVSNVTATTANLSWQANDATNWVVEYDTVGFTLGNGIQMNVSGTPSTVLSGLEPSTDYDVYVYAVCDDGSATNAAFKTFRTGCLELTEVPQTWDFDANLNGGTSNYPLPDCWRRITPSSTATLYPYAYNSSYNAHSGTRSLYFYNYYPQSIAVLPAIDNTVLDITTLQVTFFAKISSVNNNAALEVGVMTDPMDASTFTPVQALTLTDSYPATAYEIPFMNYTGNGQYIAFRNTTSSTLYNYIYVDDVTLEAIPACSRPLNLATVSTTETTATLSWVSTADAFTLHYKPSTDSTWQSESNVTLTGGSYTLGNLTAGTTYDWYVETACGIDTELVSDTRHFTTQMIPTSLPYSTDFTTDQNWLLKNSDATNRWVMGTPTGDTEGALFISNNGTNAQYTITSRSIVVAEKLFTMPSSDSVHVSFDVKVGGEGTSTPYDYLKVFLSPATVDYGAGAIESTPQSGYAFNEYAFNFANYASMTSDTSHFFKLSLTNDSVLHIDMNMAKPDASGQAKIVFLWRNDNSAGTQPGAVIRNFTINTDLTPVVTNPTVATSAATAVAQTTATLNGTITNPDNVTISAKGFQWKTTTGGTYQTVNATGTGLSYNLTGLTAATGYTFRAFITFNGQTVYGNEMTFTTLPEDVQPCETPTGLTVASVENHAVTVTWDANSNVNSWNIRYRKANEGSWSSATANTNSYTISNLDGNTDYEIQVQADCGDGNQSDWTASATAHTTNVGISSWLENSVRVFPNPANDFVNVQCTMYNVQLGADLHVFDVCGKLVQTVPMTGETTILNISSLADGMYFVRVTTEAGVVTKPFVVKR